jgi:hypothetical protein
MWLQCPWTAPDEETSPSVSELRSTSPYRERSRTASLGRPLLVFRWPTTRIPHARNQFDCTAGNAIDSSLKPEPLPTTAPHITPTLALLATRQTSMATNPSERTKGLQDTISAKTALLGTCDGVPLLRLRPRLRRRARFTRASRYQSPYSSLALCI